MNLEEINSIKSIVELPPAESGPMIVSDRTRDALPVLTPLSVDLGCLKGPYTTLHLEVLNPGTHARLFDWTSSEPDHLFWVERPGECPGYMGRARATVMLRAGALKPQRYRFSVSLAYESDGFSGKLHREISFWVTPSPRFRFDVHPRVLVAPTNQTNRLILECCNFSESQGLIFIRLYNPGRYQGYSAIHLAPRQVYQYSVDLSSPNDGKMGLQGQVVVADRQGQFEIVVPIYRSRQRTTT